MKQRNEHVKVCTIQGQCPVSSLNQGEYWLRAWNRLRPHQCYRRLYLLQLVPELYQPLRPYIGYGSDARQGHRQRQSSDNSG